MHLLPISKSRFYELLFFFGTIVLSLFIIPTNSFFNSLLFENKLVRVAEPIIITSQSVEQSTIFLPIVSTREVWRIVGQNSGSNGRITDLTHYQGAFSSSIVVAEDGVVYVAYSARDYDGSDNSAYIYVLRWAGVNWEFLGAEPVNEDYEGHSPHLAISPNNELYIAFSAYYESWFPDGCPPNRIVIKRWNGVSWEQVDESNPECASGISGYINSYIPQIDFSPSGKLYVTWDGSYSENSSQDHAFVKQWNGQDWIAMDGSGSDGSIAEVPAGKGPAPVIGVNSNETVYVAWHGLGLSAAYWQNGSWNNINSGLPGIPGIPGMVSMVIATDGTPYIAWQQLFDDVWQIYVKMWNGSSWVEVGNSSATNGGISNTVTDSISPSISISDEGIYVAWLELRGTINNFGDIYVRYWNGSIWEEVGQGSATGDGVSNSNNASVPQIAMDNSGGRVYIVWPNVDEMGVGQVHIKYANE